MNQEHTPRTDGAVRKFNKEHCDGSDYAPPVNHYVHAAFARQLERELAAAKEQIELLRGALKRVERWHGEFPKTGQYWDVQKQDEMSYAARFGSHGERDYMRDIARAALESTTPKEETR